MEDYEARMAALAKKRADRNAEIERKEAEQELIDLEAIFEIEEQIGVKNVAKVRVNYAEDLPVLVAVRCPTGPEMKRYKDMGSTTNKEGNLDLRAHRAAVEALATACLKYPDPDTYALLKEARPGLHTVLGNAAVKLATGREEDEGKD